MKSFPSRIKTECKGDFRVEKRDIIPLPIDARRVPPGFQCYNGTICDGVEGLCIMLKGFANPRRYSDMIPIFGKSVPELTMIRNEVVNWMYIIHDLKVT